MKGRGVAAAQKEKEGLEKTMDTMVRDKNSLHLEPLHEFSQSIFTVDNIYETEILGSTDAATKIYEEYVSLKDNFVAKNNIPLSWDMLVN